MLLGTQRVNAQGRLEIGGCDTVALAQEFGTPLYVVDEAELRVRCRAYVSAFADRYPRNRIHYASKALLNLAVARIIAQEGLCLDTASYGELFTALRARFPASRINLHGSNKLASELELAVRRRIGHITLDNFGEIDLVAAAAAAQQRPVRVLVRVAPGVHPDTHRFISTGQADTKFGFNILDGSAMEAVQRVLASPALRFDGIHFHVGSQLLDTVSHEEAIAAAVDLMAQVRATTGALCHELNIGGGLGVRYLSTHEPPALETYAERITGALRSALARHGLPMPVLAQEPGRSLVAEAGTTLYTVGAIKTVPTLTAPGSRTYASIDGGLSDNPRPQLYEAVYEVIAANKADRPHDRTLAIAGRHCETDVLIWGASAPELEPGDTLAVQTTGAYNAAMASNYNKFLRPAMVLVGDGRADLIVERETPADLVRHDCVPARLKAGART
jgi:diaminopimelate decarboxylase